MLSILIPIYNYNAYPLVKELHSQCLEAKIDFEILCQDDFSNEYLKENQEINTLENCSFSSNTANLGRGININKIARKAKQEWLLILDCDTFPKDSKFIERYLVEIQKNDQQIIFGGIIYDQKKPASNQLLRWVYGNEREALSIQLRNKNPDNSALTSNLLLKKELFSV
ncbi:glycosyltransferase family 2 protein [Flavobacterium sp. ACAM 123]|uniref:glycosyltransferase family 2 protein n=1 Tax=Flavobacterium sp. ACAM 123 TaxID=1189620 RepID=UPI00031F62AB|nr:glycosyltransferase [Flavobacterium sp. ACAM 123]